MRIALFSDNFYPELSGIADSILTLARELSSRGHEILFCAPRYSAENYKLAGVSNQELDLGEKVKFYRFPSLPFPGPTKQARLVVPLPFIPQEIKKFKPEIIHTQQFFGVGLNALYIARKLKIPLIGTNHTAVSEFIKFSPIKLRVIQELAIKYMVWYYNKCGYVTAPSESVFKEMEQYGFNRPHQALSNPLSLTHFESILSDQKTFLKQHLGLSFSNIIFYAGRLAPEKNIETIFKAMPAVLKEVPDTILALAGHGTSQSSLRSLAEELKISANIKFLGLLNKTELHKAYYVADMFVIMSTSETQSLTLMEGMSSGLPVIGAKARALPEYINDRNGFLVEPYDFKNLAEKIIFLLKNPAERLRLGQGGSEFVQQFSAPRIADRWIEIYKEALLAGK